jgi:putative transposase
VLTGGVGRDCERVIRGVCVERGWEVVRLAVQADHVHLFVRACPSTPASEIAGWCKGRTSRVVCQSHPELLRLPSLWTRSFFCSTVGNVSQQTVEGYIAARGRR